MDGAGDFPHSISDETVEDYADPNWRLRNLYYIRNEAGEEVKFVPNWVQADFLLEMWYFNLVLKARQLGFTTEIDIFLLDVCLWNPNVAAAIIADTEDKAKEIFDNIVKFAYENIDSWIRLEGVVVEENNRSSIKFKNGSSITVGVSIRGLTFQYLHISELGKIDRFSPIKSEEIKTGAINTVHAGQMIFIESTAQGMEGLFYELCDQAMKAKEEGRGLTPLSFKFHFYPWYLDDRYQLVDEDVAKVIITEEHHKYFKGLEDALGIEISVNRRAWYVEKERVLGEKMKQEYPSTPQEAFEVSLEGKILAREMMKVRSEGRILDRIPVLPNVPVNVFWDLGYRDLTALWFHQRIGPENRLLRYYENSGYGLAHYINEINSHGYLIGKFYLPHDAEHHRLTKEQYGKSVYDLLLEMHIPARNLVVVPLLENKWTDGIETLRSFLVTCVFDGRYTQKGIARLDNYKKTWNQQLGAWRNEPADDENAHGADSLETGARGFEPGPVTGPARRRHRPGRATWKTV